METVAYRPGNHLTLSAKSSARDEIIKRQYTPRSLMLSKILRKKKNKTKLTKETNTIEPERKTMMYIDPEANNEGHHEGHHHEGHHHEGHHHVQEGHHHARPQHHTKVPEGYYRCSHGCLCRKGTHHEGETDTHHAHVNPQTQQPGMMGTMANGAMGGAMGGAMQGAMMGGPSGAMQGGLQGGMQGGMMSMMPPPPTANNPIINQVGNVGGGLMGMLGQGLGVANGLSQQFTSLAARKFLFLFF